MPHTLLDYIPLTHAPEDFTPTCPIRITVRGDASRVFSPHARAGLSVERTSGKIHITLDRLEMHEVIVLENWHVVD